MNTKFYIICILLLILFYFIHKNKKESFIDFDGEEEKEKDLKLVNIFNEMEIIKNINQPFYNISHIPEFLTKNFNYNDFELEFTIDRNTKMITDLEGGILTLGNTNLNFHNLFIYIKKTELIIGLVGYNTNLSINLNKIKTLTNINIKLIYRNPYINIYITGSDINNNIVKGYLDYLGNVTENPNKNFRLYYHPLNEAWCSLGTVNFIKIINEKNNLDSATGILSQIDTTIKNIKISHKKRNMTKLEETNGIKSITHYNKLNIDMNNILIMELKLDENINIDGLLFKLFTQKKTYLGFEKQQNRLKLNLYDNKNKSTIAEINYENNIENLYIEIIPYMNLHLFTIYINNNFYKYIIDISILKNKTNNKIIFTDITINDSTKNIQTSLINNFSIYTETLPFNIDLLTVQKLEPIIKKENDYSLLINFNKIIKLEFFKLLKMENTNYKLYIKNVFTNNWKLLYKLNINNNNQSIFIDQNLPINDNLFSNQYKLEVYNNLYELEPLNSQLAPDNTLVEENTSNMKIINKAENAKLDYGNSTKWIFDNITDNLFNIYTNSPGVQNNLTDLGSPYIVEKKPNTSNIFYIKINKGTTSSPIYKYLGIGINEGKIAEFDDKINCEFKKIPLNSISLNDSIEDLIELYGIENPYPKLYINNNDLSQSTSPCSYIYSKENKIIEELQSKIINIDQKFDKPESINFLNNVGKYIIPDKKKNLSPEVINDIENKIPIQNIKMAKIEGNIYDKNKIYNFCSNNLEHFNNKMYSYDYSKQRYYYQDPKQIYNYKKRVMVGELSKQELDLLLNINKLKSGINFVGISNNKNLTNTSVFNDLDNLWSNSNQNFILEWDENEGFNNPSLINIKINVNGNYRVLKDIYISENILEEPEIKESINNYVTEIYNTVKSSIENIKKSKPYTEISYMYTELDPNIVDEMEDGPEKTAAQLRLQDKEQIINLVVPPTEIECNINNNVNLNFKNESLKIVKDFYLKVNKNQKGVKIITKKKWPEAYNFLKKYKSPSFGGSGGDSYTRYTKDRTKYETNIIKRIFERNISKSKNNSKKTLIDNYINRAIPKILLEDNQEILNSKTKFWKLEWDNIYEPEKTEFHLFHLLSKKYLINENNMLKWSNDKIIGNGWKLLEKNVTTNLITSENKLKNKEKYKQNVKNILIQHIIQQSKIGKKNINKLINKSNEITVEKEHEFKIKFEDKNENLRINDIKQMSNSKKGINLFSPNIGIYGSFLKQPFKDTKKYYFNWAGDNFNANIYIDLYSTNGPNTQKTISRKIDCEKRTKSQEWKDKNCKDNTTILISRKIKNTIYYLKNKPNNKNQLEWISPNGPFPSSLKWNMEWNEKLYLDLNKKNIEYKVNLQKENILQKYFLVENKRVTIKIGKIISNISNRHIWVDIYDAIKWAEEQGFKGCLDYAWVKKGSNNKAYFYDDNHMLENKSAQNTLTNGWYVLNRDPRFSELYLEYNRLLYTFQANLIYTKIHCFNHNRYGNCIRRSIKRVFWNDFGRNSGINKWYSQTAVNAKVASWKTRRDTMYNNIQSYIPCEDSIIKPTEIYFKSLSTQQYLRSDSTTLMKFFDTKEPTKCAWYLLMKNDMSKWMENYNLKITDSSEKFREMWRDHSFPGSF